VLDTIAGGGVVGEAALNLKRNCIWIELAHRNIVKIRDRFAGNPFFREVFWHATI
jgi:site-specific DNA-methyltransferase (adenine-specific)